MRRIHSVRNRATTGAAKIAAVMKPIEPAGLPWMPAALRTSSPPKASSASLGFNIADGLMRRLEEADVRIREGRFQAWLGLISGLSSALTGLEVGYLHYRGSYSRRVMYTPVILSAVLAGTGVWSSFNRWAAERLLPAVSLLTVADAAVGQYFHIRGIQRKPGGWRLPVTNIMMGPPIFAPLLFSTSAYLGLVASFLRREDDPPFAEPKTEGWFHLPARRHQPGWVAEISTGHFQKHLAVATAISALCSGTEALYSHYKNNFRYKVQWTPVIVAPVLVLAGIGTLISPRIGRTWLSGSSVAAILSGALGFWYHARGIKRRPGGYRMLFYNILHGPPILAPLLFAAAGFTGVLASLMRREV
jgi:hypothetical protein